MAGACSTYTAIDELGNEASLRFYVTVRTPVAAVKTDARGAVTITALAAGEHDITFTLGEDTFQLRVKVDEGSIGSRLTLRSDPALFTLDLVEFSGTATDDLIYPTFPQGFRRFGELQFLTITLRDRDGIIMDRLDTPARICLTPPSAGDGVLIMLRYDGAEGWTVLASAVVTSADGSTLFCADSARISTFAAGYAVPPSPQPSPTPTPAASQVPDSTPGPSPTPAPTAIPTPTVISPTNPTPAPTNLPEQVGTTPTPFPSPTPPGSADSVGPAEPTLTPSLSPTPTAPADAVGQMEPTPTHLAAPTSSSPAASPTAGSTIAPTAPPTPSQAEHLRGPGDSARTWTLIGIPIALLVLGATFFIYRRSLRP